MVLVMSVGAWAAPKRIYVDGTAGGGGDGSTWGTGAGGVNARNEADFVAYLEASAAPDDYYYIRTNRHTRSTCFSFKQG